VRSKNETRLAYTGLASDGAEYPVTGPRGVAEERHSKNEQLVSQRQVPDVVVADGAVTYRRIARDDVQHQGVAVSSKTVYYYSYYYY